MIGNPFFLNANLSYNLWFINMLSFAFGGYFLIDYYFRDNQLTDCNHIITLIGISLGGNILPVITCSQLACLNGFIFSYSGAVVGYNVYNYYQLSQTCIDYYSQNYHYLWIYYLIGTIIHGLNLIVYLLKLGLGIQILLIQKKWNEEDQRRLYREEDRLPILPTPTPTPTPEGIYEDTETH